VLGFVKRSTRGKKSEGWCKAAVSLSNKGDITLATTIYHKERQSLTKIQGQGCVLAMTIAVTLGRVARRLRSTWRVRGRLRGRLGGAQRPTSSQAVQIRGGGGVERGLDTAATNPRTCGVLAIYILYTVVRVRRAQAMDCSSATPVLVMAMAFQLP